MIIRFTEGELKIMRKVFVDTLTGNEILAKDIYSNSGIILMAAGTVVHKEYISRMKDLNIDYIYVEDELSKGIKEDEIIEIQIKKQCHKTVKVILEKYAYCGNAELENLKGIAEEIIDDLLEQPQVMFNIAGVRQKSEGVYSHSLNVCALSVFIALRMKIPRKKINEIAVGSLLHDIGYNYLPIDYNKLDYDKFEEKDLNEIKKHVIYGYSAVENEKWLSSVAKDIILSHHEKMNGTGYPFHINDDKIKLGSKIVAVCDEFDRMVYGIMSQKVKVHEAIEYVVGQGGVLFDMNVVRIFNESVAAYPNGTLVITNDDEKGIVLRQNIKCPTRPVIRLIKNKNNENYEEWTERDLTKDLTLFIKDTIEVI
jgi:putative nucleotidyltransferase with HDIG domain